MKELEILLENFWIVKEKDKALYYRIKDAYPKFKPFLEEKLGYKLLITPYVIKLQKLPGKAESWMGIQGFEDVLEYAFLCMLLVFLEDKGPEEQFVLSQITEFIEGAFPEDTKVDWTLYTHRRYLVKVMRFAQEMHLIKLDDGTDHSFISTIDAEVLYENTGLSKYFVQNFTGNVLSYDSLEDIEKGEWLDLDRDRGRIRRNRVYRRLFMAPAVYAEGADDPDYLYIKNYRNMLQKDVADILDSELHIHKNGAFVVLDESKHFKDVFPSNKNISDIVLQLNGLIRELLDKGEISSHQDDSITISISKFESMLTLCSERYSHGWSKEYREMRPAKLYEEVTAYMQSFSMLTMQPVQKEITLLPLTGKMTGKYPLDFQGEK